MDDLCDGIKESTVASEPTEVLWWCRNRGLHGISLIHIEKPTSDESPMYLRVSYHNLAYSAFACEGTRWIFS